MPHQKIQAAVDAVVNEAIEQERERCIHCVESQKPFVRDNPVVISLLNRIANFIRRGEQSPVPPEPPVEDLVE
jgi:hypothetical protein